ncbi:isocitrate lyase/PEP mutase family protein [Nonomuraea endophytica]|uniref:2-methylisocitrate lyase-like PEP mutase family enzyme n=1 Tax=Nonomuraea endophytica TaxID=714136 RepID=A0A7W8A7I0_9ACTN|nr:isocitrate lyase/phosphoenolpyruvate mutase family protein [Nonomuraea endophytica]MBB5079638.1 2-methylisocitrate lyase-like PEP mutase family enzyme [Nonomuraea endophytica]
MTANETAGEVFGRLHVPGRPLLLPNAWDYGSAATLAAEGYPAIGTTSLGVAAVHGKPDAAGATKQETIALAKAMAGLGVLVTVDIEGGFSDDPAEVATLVAELGRAGIAGVNLEDGRPDGTLRAIAHHQEIIEAALGHGVFVNARTDAHWLKTGDDAVERVQAYERADGVFVPGLTDPARIAEIVRSTSRPVNVLYGPPMEALAEAGVARVSTGSLLYRASLRGMLAVLGDEGRAMPTYDQIAAMLPQPR